MVDVIGNFVAFILITDNTIVKTGLPLEWDTFLCANRVTADLIPPIAADSLPHFFAIICMLIFSPSGIVETWHATSLL